MKIRIADRKMAEGTVKSVDIEDAYSVKEALKSIGYRWSPIDRTWFVTAENMTEALDKVAELFENGIADADMFQEMWEHAGMMNSAAFEGMQNEEWQMRIGKALGVC